MKEVWKDVVGWEGIYQVSDQGRVKSLSRVVRNRYGMCRLMPDRILKGFKIRGHLCVGLRPVGGKKRDPSVTKMVSRLVLLAFVGPCPENMECRHRNGDVGDSRLKNVYWGIRLQGEDHPRARITEKKVRKIRARYATGNYTMQSLADWIGVSITTIHCIVRRRIWKHVTD